MKDGKTILITGGSGFIGSHFVRHMLHVYRQYRLVNFDKLTYAASNDNLIDSSDDPNYHFVHGDICNTELVEQVFKDYQISGVIHFAAESHVDNSIVNPDTFIKTNIDGTHTLLKAAYRNWMDGPFACKPGFEQARFLQISTDEVYGSLGEKGIFTEASPYQPNSPYSASKASADMLVRSYHHTYGLPVVTTISSNNYGPNQHQEKLIPTVITRALSGQSIPIYGDGKNVRNWLYVEDNCRGIDAVFHNGLTGESYNIGGKDEWSNLYLVTTICELLDKLVPRQGSSYKELITFVNDRPGHDFRYALSTEKIESELGWQSMISFTEGLEKTITFTEGLEKTITYYLDIKS